MLRLVAILVLLSAVAFAEITGKPAIIDGDTIEIAGQRIRLHGIDAPESKQTCLANGKRWHCGFEAEAALAFFIAKTWVTCLERDRDRYGRVVAICYAGGVGGPDLGRWMVSQGWALAYRQYSTTYIPEEAQAQAGRKGLWRGEFVPPAAWRQGQRLAP